MVNFTYLIPHAGSEELYKICKDSILKHTPAPIQSVDFTAWPDAFRQLFNQCPTDIGVFIDDDAVLLDDIRPLVQKVADGYDMVAPEEIIPFNKGGWLRYAPGYYQTSFMILNIGEFKRKYGVQGLEVDAVQARKEIGPDRAVEFHYGISQNLRKGGAIVNLKAKPTKYGMATTYEFDKPYVLHMWYGAWKFRHETEFKDELEAREKQFVQDYWSNNLHI